MSALDIQREYLAKAKDFTSSRGGDAVSERVLPAGRLIPRPLAATA